ncbi:required for meiotic nuclear division protein 1, partial [Tremellales sp. Uapishka_1]
MFSRSTRLLQRISPQLSAKAVAPLAQSRTPVSLPFRKYSSTPSETWSSPPAKGSILFNKTTVSPKQKLPTSHKPPKRRLEAASAPLRSNPPPTRGPILSCIAHTTAERYDLLSLGLVLRSSGVRWDEVPEGDRERAFVIGPWKGRGGAERMISGKDTKTLIEDEEDIKEVGFGYGQRGEIWVFNSGSFVTWGLTKEEGRAFLRDVIRRKGAGVEIDRLAPKEFEVEEVDFVVDPTAKTSILGNLILLGQPPVLSTFPTSPSLASLLARYTLSLSLTRSSSLSVLEDRLDSHIASVSTLPRALEKWGAQPMGRKEVIRKIGELMTLRMAVNTRGGGLEETPEFYWSEPELEEYFDSVATEFEIKERIDAINKKIDYAQEVQSTLRALLTEASGHRMELIIIALIAVEVVIVLIREGQELYHKLAYPFIELVHSLIPGESNEAPSEVLHKDLARVEDAVARNVPKWLSTQPETNGAEGRRLV